MAGAGVRDILIDGPWQHVDIAANGPGSTSPWATASPASRRLVLLLHGFAEFWWAWRHQIPALDAAGYAVAAMDLRGYGASDKTPRGYDPRTTAARHCRRRSRASVTGRPCWSGTTGAAWRLGHRRVRPRAGPCAGHDRRAAPARLSVAAEPGVSWRSSSCRCFPSAGSWPTTARTSSGCCAPRAAPAPRLAVGCRRPALPRCAACSGPARTARWSTSGCSSAISCGARAGTRVARSADRVRVPLLAVHGDLDPVLPVDKMRAAEDRSRWPADAGPPARRRSPAPRGRSGGLYVGPLELAGHPGLSTDPFLGIPGGSLPCLSLSKGS